MNTTVKKPDNYLAWSILSTLFCCLPFGIVAIVKSTQVDTYWGQGDMESAVQAAKDAKKWIWISVGTVLGITVIYLIIIAIVAVIAVANS